MPRFQTQGNGYGQLQHTKTVFEAGQGDVSSTPQNIFKHDD